MAFFMFYVPLTFTKLSKVLINVNGT